MAANQEQASKGLLYLSDLLSFPGLGLEFELSRTAFTVGGMPIYWYGIIIAVAFLAGAMYVLRRVKTFGLDGDRMMDTIIVGVILGVVCARLYYVLFSGDSTYLENPLTIFNIRLGGIAIYGGIIGAVIAALLMSKLRRVKLLPMLDAVSGGLLIGQAIGRWGNFVNVEAFGSNTTLPWGMTSPGIQWYLQQNQARLAAIGVTVDPAVPVHPTFLYESIWCLLGFLFLAWYTGRRRFDGELGLIYIGWYGFGRFFIEGLRTDPLLIGTIRVSQLVAILCVIASVVAMALVRSRIRRANDPAFLPLYATTDEGKAVIAGEFYKKKDDKGKPEEEKADSEAADAAGASEERPAPAEAAQDETPEDPAPDEVQPGDAAPEAEPSEQAGEQQESETEEEQ